MSAQTLMIRYFASARDGAGCDAETVPFVDAEGFAGLRARLQQLHPGLARILPTARFARVDEFCFEDEVIHPGDELLVLPPASGGAPRVLLCERPLEVGEMARELATDGAGGLATFTGIVRKENLGKSVHFLEFSAHAPLAEKELARICEEAIARFGLTDARVAHRLGRVELDGVAVDIAVAAPHRKEAFAGCAYVIDELKKRVPIWKKETTADGAAWTSPTP